MVEEQYIILMIYDIVDNRRRYRMVKCLESYGVRVQKSAFEALLTKKQYEKMLRQSSAIIDKNDDSLRVYILDDIVNVYTWGRGERHEADCIII